jgi:hypothetical protein
MVNRFIISTEIGVDFFIFTIFLVVHHSRWDRDGWFWECASCILLCSYVLSSMLQALEITL